jgi:hypothetical protein
MPNAHAKGKNHIKIVNTGQEIYENNHDGKGLVKTKTYKIIEVHGSPSLPNNNDFILDDGITVPVLEGNILTDSQIDFLKDNHTEVEYDN